MGQFYLVLLVNLSSAFYFSFRFKFIVFWAENVAIVFKLNVSEHKVTKGVFFLVKTLLTHTHHSSENNAEVISDSIINLKKEGLITTPEDDPHVTSEPSENEEEDSHPLIVNPLRPQDLQ